MLTEGLTSNHPHLTTVATSLPPACQAYVTPTFIANSWNAATFNSGAGLFLIVSAQDCYNQIVYTLTQMSTATKDAFSVVQRVYLDNFGSYTDGQAIVTSLTWNSFTGTTT